MKSLQFFADDRVNLKKMGISEVDLNGSNL